MKKLLLIFFSVSMLCCLSSCAKKQLGAPCPNFGSHCRKTPINTWDDHAYR